MILSYDLDLGLSRTNFEKSVSQEWDGRLAWKKSDVSKKLDSFCDFELWPWPWIYKVKFYKSRISGMRGAIDMEWKEGIWINRMLDPLCDLELWPWPCFFQTQTFSMLAVMIRKNNISNLEDGCWDTFLERVNNEILQVSKFQGIVAYWNYNGVRDLDQHCFKQWLVTSSAPSLYPNLYLLSIAPRINFREIWIEMPLKMSVHWRPFSSAHCYVYLIF